MEWVFGYASLVDDYLDQPGSRLCVLGGYRRVLGVAADNSVVAPGYKAFLSREDGGQPEVFVAFVDIVEAADSEITGVAIPVESELLGVLDRRERNYVRTDVSGQIAGLEGRVWTYIGSDEGRARLRRGRETDRAVVSRDYIERVDKAFEALGPEEYARFQASSTLDDLPVADLDRVDRDEAAARR